MLYFKLDDNRQDIIDHFEDVNLRHGVGFDDSDGGMVYWPTTTTVEPVDEEYLCFVAQQNNTTFRFSGTSVSNTIQYSLDNGGTWTTLANNTDSPSVASGGTILFKASNLIIDATNGIGHFSSNGNFQVKGNIMSLLHGDGFIDKWTLTNKNGIFAKLFSGCTGLTTAENLVLPATMLSENCYGNMFLGCTSMVTGPLDLIALTAPASCYSGMFSGCTSLSTAPSLPAMTLGNACYYGMFAGCTSLSTAPALPAKTLSDNCYKEMFANCTGIEAAPNLNAGTLAVGCYYGMFYGCTSLTSAPQLSAPTLSDSCYKEMFYGCSSLSYIKCLATDISAVNCTTNWTYAVSGSGTFVRDKSTDEWEIGSVNGIPNGWTVNPPIDQSKLYLTFISLSDNNRIGWRAGDRTGSSGLRTIEVSTDGGATWVSKTSTTNGTELSTLSSGQSMLIRGDNNSYCSGYSQTYGYANNFFTSSGNFKVEGNAMSLINSTDFSGLTQFTADYAFCGLFSGCTGLTTAENLVLPATTLASNCYRRMFYGCTSLTVAPVQLPATTLTSQCYMYMFQGCTSLTTAPYLGAETLATQCYAAMFSGCTNLTTAQDVLPATALSGYCYQYMFAGCTNLTTAPALPATTLTDGCYSGMFYSCSAMENAPSLGATNLALSCYTSMFADCTGIGSFGVLPATNLQAGCYVNMFSGCTNLTGISEISCASITSTTAQQMFDGCSKLTWVKCLATGGTALGGISVTNWMRNVKSTGTFYKRSTANWSSGANGIPSGWSSPNA